MADASTHAFIIFIYAAVQRTKTSKWMYVYVENWAFLGNI